MGASWTDWKFKKLSFWSVVFSYFMQQQWTISRLDCDVWPNVDFIWQLVTTSSVAGPRRSSKALPKARIAAKKVMVTVWWSAACLIHCSFLNPSEIWDECSANQWDAPKTATSAAGNTAQKTRLNSPQQHLTAHCTSNASKVKWTGLPSFASSAIFTWFLEKWLPLLQAFWQGFAGKMLPQPAGGRKYFLRVHRISKHRYLCYRNQQTNFSLAKMCWF